MSDNFQFSKIKNVLIELHNYYYSNNSNDDFENTDTFIGRSEIIDVLKSLLTNSNSKNGAYLVTGYRGMGKTSFVNKVLSELNFNESIKDSSSRFLRIGFFLIILSFINFNPFSTNYLTSVFSYFLIIIFGFTFFYLNRKYYIRLVKPKPVRIELAIFHISVIICLVISSIISVPPVNNYIVNGILFFLLMLLVIYGIYSNLTVKKNKGKKFIKYLFQIDNIDLSNIKFKLFTQDFFIVLSIYFLIRISENTFNTSTYNIYMFVCTILVVVLIFINKFFLNNLKDKREGFRDSIVKVKNYFNYSNFLVIKINLGYDKLKELDILKLVTKSILSTYSKRLRISNLYEFGWVLLKFFSIYFVFCMMYYQIPFYQINLDLEKNFKIIEYFPSQGIQLINDDTNFKETVNKIINKKHESGNIIYEINDYLDLFKRNLSDANLKDSNLFRKITSLNDERKIFDYIRMSTIYLDYYVFFTFHKFSRYLYFLEEIALGDSKISQQNFNEHYSIPIDSRFKLIPSHLDYMFWIYLIAICLILKFTLKINLFNIVTSGYILNRLNKLNEKINNQISSEKGVSAPEGVKQYFGVSFKKVKTTEKADIREIESELIDIMEEVQRMPRILRRPEFIIVFDEIDKIEPHKNVSILEKEEENVKLDNDDNTNVKIDGNRKRQHNIFRLLSNLKHFLNTAKSKFIFIAGREMYDAALADISDRNFFIGSIFNQVIYVDSFLKDQSSNRTSDITSMTETYVCKFLIPTDCSLKKDEGEETKFCLKYYSRYLKDELRKENNEIIKIISTLQFFITYITYRSNGAPKKIATLFEKFITAKEKSDIEEIEGIGINDLNSKYILVNRNYNRLFLMFGFTYQYIFGMTSYLINPFFLSINRSINDYTDKLLVSSSFIIDHIYKFHRSAFSWRNIELIPEIVDINKAPHLRDLISSFLKYLSNTHVLFINNGLFKFKFNRKIEEEITFISKKNEQESAAFNFTLDESLSIKRHFKKQLMDLENIYKSHYSTSEEPEFIRSISILHSTLGDLHFYDQEYDDSILEYSESIQLFGNNKFSSLSIETYVSMVRNTLKLGLTYEKKRTYEPAFMIYGKLCSRLIKLKNDPIENKQFKKIGKDLLKTLYANNNIEDFEYLSNRFNIIETLRLLHQPLLSKFHIKEKISQCGITKFDYQTLLIEYDELFKDSIIEKNYILEIEFFSKVGDILFFKNGSQFIFKSDFEINANDNLITDNKVYCQKENSLCIINNAKRGIEGKGYKLPCNACNIYMNNLKLLCTNYFFINFDDVSNCVLSKMLLVGLLSFLAFPEIKLRIKFYIKNKNTKSNYLINVFKADIENLDLYKVDFVLKIAGNLMSDVGDTFLSCVSGDERIKKEFLDYLNTIVKQEVKVEEKCTLLKEYLNTNKLSKIEEIILYYYLSGYYFWRAMEFRELYLQYIKILYTLSNYKNLRELNSSEYLKELIENLCKFALHGIFKTYDEINYLEYYDLGTFFDKFENADVLIKTNTSISFDINEILFLYKKISVKLNFENHKHTIEGFRNSKLADEFNLNFIKKLKLDRDNLKVDSCSSINSMYNRIKDLELKSKISYNIYNTISESNLWNEENKNYLINLISDSIFCLYEIIKIYKVYGISYVNSHCSLGYFYEKMGDWCYRMNNLYIKYGGHKKDFEKEFQSILRILINEDNLKILNENYNFQMSMNHYKASLEMHKEGKPYKDIMENLCLLNDDLNENLMHFFCALDRFKINSNNILKRIKHLDEYTQDYNEYNITKYVAQNFIISSE